MGRKTTFWLALVYLTVILVVGVLFFVKRELLIFVPESFGPLAVGIPWFGALGAVMISLTGVFEHEHDWDTSYWPWHVARPLVGAALGVVSVLIMQAGVLSVNGTIQQPGSTSQPTSTQTGAAATPGPVAKPSPTTTPAPASTASPTPAASPTSTPQGSSTPVPPTNSKGPGSSNLLYYLVAFLVGYREETFRELIKRLVDVVLSPGNAATPAPSIHAVSPVSVPHNAPTDVTITGSGFASTQSVKFGSVAAKFKVDADGQLTVTPVALSAAGTVLLTVITKGGSASVNFTFS
jgi:hypothetical protein